MIPEPHLYQQNIIDAIKEVIPKHRMIVVVIATGGGKGFIMGRVARLLAQKKTHSLLLSHRYEIHRQLVKHCVRQEVSPGQIVSGLRMSSNLIQVGMVQTVHRKLKPLSDCWYRAILPDEFHHYVSRTFSEVINYRPESKVIGFTATPYRTDGRGLWESGATYMIEGPQTADLVQAAGSFFLAHDKGIPQSKVQD